MLRDLQRGGGPARGRVRGSPQQWLVRNPGWPLVRLWILLLGLAASAGPSRAQFSFFWEEEVKLEVAAQLSHGPGGMTITPKGSYIVSLHQYYRTQERVVEITPDGKTKPFAEALQTNSNEYAGLVLDSVMGVECDSKGVVWMLDNGRREETVPKLVAWDTDDDKLSRVIYLPPPVTTPTSFLSDLALDPSEPFVYISDPASGEDAAILVVDLTTGLARRVLMGRDSVVPEDVEMRVEGRELKVVRPDGSVAEPQIGVNPIALDRRGDWLYFGPMKGRTLYRVSTTHLRDKTLTPQELASRVQGYAEKPFSDSISIDSKGNIYVADLGRSAIGVIDAKDRKYELYVTDPRLSWPDGLCFGTDGRLHFYTNQLHRSGTYNGGKSLAEPPFLIFKVRALASGAVGR